MVDPQPDPQIETSADGSGSGRPPITVGTNPDEPADAVTYAQQEASQLGDSFVGPEHILLALLRYEGGIARKVLAEFGVTIEKVRSLVAEIRYREFKQTGKNVPFTPAAKDVLERSCSWVKFGTKPSLGSEHILLALTETKEDASLQLFNQLDVDLVELQKKTLELISEM